MAAINEVRVSFIIFLKNKVPSWLLGANKAENETRAEVLLSERSFS